MASIRSFDNQFQVVPVTTEEQKRDAFLVRALCFVDQENTSIRAVVDGNDFQATHFVAYVDNEPVGSARVRWFSDFAKFERSCFLPKYRNHRAVCAVARCAFDHIATKGYSKVITYARPAYAKIWRRLLGFEINEEKPTLRLALNEEPYLELVKTLNEAPNRISLDSEPYLMERIEGFWNTPVSYEVH